MNEIRTAIVDLLQQMRQLRDCIPDQRYRPLERQITQVSEQFSTTCLSYEKFRDIVNEFCSRNAVDADQVYIDPCSIPVPYEDYDDPGIEISLSREETDQEYLYLLQFVFLFLLVLFLLHRVYEVDRIFLYTYFLSLELYLVVYCVYQDYRLKP